MPRKATFKIKDGWEMSIQEDTEPFVVSLLGSTLTQIIFSCGLVLVLYLAFGTKGPNVYYGGGTLTTCDPDIMLYSIFVSGLLYTIAGGISASVSLLAKQHQAARTGTAVMTSGLIAVGFSSLFIMYTYGHLFLFPVHC